MTLDYDIIVIGGGHAGCEAASAAARLGSRTLLLTMDMSKLAAMSCNPAVGGVAKGQIVREIDALGGQMGRITDLTTIQFRMLNRSKGAANVESPCAMRQNPFLGGVASHTLENTLEPLYLAGRRDRTAVRPGSGNKRGAVGQSARRNHNVVQFRARHDFFGSRIGCRFRSDTPKCTVGRRKTRHPGRSDPHGRRIFLPEVILTSGTFLEE